MTVRSAFCAAFLVLIPAALRGQATLEEAAARAKEAWAAHDPQRLVGQSSALALQIPGADPSAPLGRAQAVELLRRYLRQAEERGLDITAIREVEPGRGFVELTRRYVVAGTSELRRESLFLGFRRAARTQNGVGEWQLVEVRSAP